MNKIKSIALGAVFLSLSGSTVFAATDLTVSGNGAQSNTEVLVVEANLNAVVQSNNVMIGNQVMVNNSNGGNTIQGTTGGDSTIKAGALTTNVTINNTAGSNVAHNPCGCADIDPDLTLKVKDNGYKADVKIAVMDLSASIVGQQNNVALMNGVGVAAQNGNNKIKNTTGGSSKIKTAKITTRVNVTNMAGSNVYGVPAL